MRKLTREEFIWRAREVHKDSYDYSELQYSGRKKKVKIRCLVHGFFEQRAERHLYGAGCRLCAAQRIGKENTLSTKDFVDKVLEVHNGKYDYNAVVYYGMNRKIEIICPYHGAFEQEASNHLRGQGCKKCQTEKSKSNKDVFISKARQIHGSSYNYDQVVYSTAIAKISITCPHHGMFHQKPNNHLRGTGCPICKTSKGERKIIEFLNKQRLLFKHQFSFNDCRGKRRPLIFDFVLRSDNPIKAIEFQGRQHFEPVFHWNGNEGLKITQESDNKKRVYCEDNGIQLLEVPYWEFKNINSILEEFLRI